MYTSVRGYIWLKKEMRKEWPGPHEGGEAEGLQERPVDVNLGSSLSHGKAQRERTATLVPILKGPVTAQSLSVLSCQMGIITGNTP